MDMQLNTVSSDGAVSRLRVAGQIIQSALANRPEPIGELLGQGAYARRVTLDLAEAGDSFHAAGDPRRHQGHAPGPGPEDRGG